MIIRTNLLNINFLFKYIYNTFQIIIILKMLKMSKKIVFFFFFF